MTEIIPGKPNWIDNYKPNKGLQKIAVAEGAEKLFAKAKDGKKLQEAVETKLTEQRRFVLWWAAQEKQAGARGVGKKVDRQTRLSTPTLADMGTDWITVSRWRQKLGDERKFEAALESAKVRCIAICESSAGQTAQRGATGTGENEWYTPAQYIAAARDVMGEIDLDPASSEAAQATIKAAKYYDCQIDGLLQEWGGRVWLNPPYAQPAISDFVSKMVEEIRSGRVTAAIMLTHNYTDTAWFHAAVTVFNAICFTRGRIKFYDASGEIAAPTQGQAFFYFGPDVDSFANVFSEIGFIVEIRDEEHGRL